MTVLRAADAPQFDLPGLVFTGLASPSRGSEDLCTWRLSVAPGHTSTEAHTIDRTEVFMVSRGAVRLTPDGDVVRKGDIAVVPAGSPIQLENAGDGKAEVIVAIASGFTATGADGTVIGTPPWAL